MIAHRSFSHMKLSGLVLMFCTFHGTAFFSPFARPDFQIHRPSRCSEHSDSIMSDCSPITRLSSASVGRWASSLFTSVRDRLMSSTFAFLSIEVTTLSTADLLISCCIAASTSAALARGATAARSSTCQIWWQGGVGDREARSREAGKEIADLHLPNMVARRWCDWGVWGGSMAEMAISPLPPRPQLPPAPPYPQH